MAYRFTLEFEDGSKLTQYGSNIFPALETGKRMIAYWINGNRHRAGPTDLEPGTPVILDWSLICKRAEFLLRA